MPFKIWAFNKHALFICDNVRDFIRAFMSARKIFKNLDLFLDSGQANRKIIINGPPYFLNDFVDHRYDQLVFFRCSSGDLVVNAVFRPVDGHRSR